MTRRNRVSQLLSQPLEGSFELVIFSEPYEGHVDLLRDAITGPEGEGPTPLLISGNLEAGDPPKVLVREIMRLDEGEQRLTTYLRVRVTEPEVNRDRMAALRNVLATHPGECPVFVHITIPGESETILSVGELRGVDPSEELQRDVDALFGRRVAERTL